MTPTWLRCLPKMRARRIASNIAKPLRPGSEGLRDDQRDDIIAGLCRPSFGSRSKNCARADSDLDLAITASDGNFVALADQWQGQLRERTGIQGYIGPDHRVTDIASF